MLSKKILPFIKDNKWIIIASIFFIAWKFFLVGILWDNRMSPPEPDDSYIYIAHIESVRECPTFIFCSDSPYALNTSSGIEHLSYRLFFGTLGKILRLDSFEIFHLSFYIGIVLLILTLVYFLKALNPNKKVIAISILFLALYNGTGAYHGFYWVVPSFFSLMLFLLIFAIINLGPKHYKYLILILTPIFAYMHSMSMYLIMLLPIFFIIYSIFLKKIDKNLLKRIIFSVLIFFICYTPATIYLSSFSKNNPYNATSLLKKSYGGISTQAFQNKNNQDAGLNMGIKTEIITYLPGLPSIKRNYLNWIILNWLGVITFSTTLVILIKNKGFKLLSLYLTAVVFMLGSSIVEYGERSLALIWPLTFILFAHGSYFILRLLKNTKFSYNSVLTILFLILIFIFFHINITYSFFWSIYQNKGADFNILPSFIEHNPKNAKKSDTIFMDPKLVKIYESLASIEKKAVPLKRVFQIENATYFYYLEINQNNTTLMTKDTLLSKLARMAGLEIKKTPPQEKIEIPENFIPYEEIGSVKIYKNIKF